MFTSNTHLALLSLLLLGTQQQGESHRYHQHRGRRLFQPSTTFVSNDMVGNGAFRPFQAYPRFGGMFSSAGPLVDVFQEVMDDIKKVARELSDPTDDERTPTYEVIETTDAATLIVDLPGCKKENVDAQISEDAGTKTLTITALRKKPLSASSTDTNSAPPPPPSESAESAATPSGMVDAEACTGSKDVKGTSPPSLSSFTEERFKLALRVGDEIDVSSIRGSLEDGVLTLVLRKLAPEPPAEPIEIPIDLSNGMGNRKE